MNILEQSSVITLKVFHGRSGAFYSIIMHIGSAQVAPVGGAYVLATKIQYLINSGYKTAEIFKGYDDDAIFKLLFY